jgi:hypothetical protein
VIDHDAVEELLASYVLGSLSGEDAAEADRLLNEHVPECLDCRRTLDAFQGLMGEVGMSATPVAPPETLLPRIERSLDGGRRRGLPSWNPARLVAAAAAAIVVVGAAGLAVAQHDDTPRADVMSQADIATVKQLKPSSDVHEINEYAKELVPPGVEELYVFGRDVPAPPAGAIYRLWTVDPQGRESWVGDFAPIDGDFVLRIAVDPATVDRVLITIEPADSEPSEPGDTAWAAA